MAAARSVSMLDEGVKGNRQAELCNLLPDCDLYFYSATTHPLGEHGYRIEKPTFSAA
jgi:hypothetical protein